ncbi:MAG: class IIb bacteriocin, lactobin A/cerein 7B family [Bacteroidota bacterium]
MKKLNLEQMGVQEMNMQEMKETDGGFLEMILGILIATVIMDGFTAGLNDKTK